MSEADALFRERLRERAAPAFGLRPRSAVDDAFLVGLLTRTGQEAAEALAGGALPPLPEALAELQGRSQDHAYRAAFPHASDHIIIDRRREQSIGRILIDWQSASDASILVDIAVLPEARRGAIGWHALRAWLSACDALQREARLHVAPENRARQLYRRLGFVEVDPLAFPVPMQRAPRPRT